VIEARVSGGKPLYLLIFTENNYHLKDFLERQCEIQGLGELFAVPCKYFTRMVSTPIPALMSFIFFQL
jgi:hypothetical protein